MDQREHSGCERPLSAVGKPGLMAGNHRHLSFRPTTFRFDPFSCRRHSRWGERLSSPTYELRKYAADEATRPFHRSILKMQLQ